MKYIFILGRNIELSIAEVESYFEKGGNEILQKTLVKNGLLIEIKDKINEEIVKDFGGVLAIGEVVAHEDLKDLDKIELYSGKENKFNYCIYNFSKNMGEFKEYLKQRF